MRRSLLLSLLLVTPALMAGTPEIISSANTVPNSGNPDFSIAASGGTLGLGTSIGYRPNAYVGFRLRGATLSYNYHDTWDTHPCHLKLNGDNAAFLLDIYPFGGNFYITAGITLSHASMRSHTAIRGKIGYDTIVHIGGREFIMCETELGHLSASYDWNRIQPYFGIGYTDTLWKGSPLYYSIDLGFNYMGSGSLKTASSGYFITKTDRWHEATQSDISAAMHRELSDFLDFADKIRFYPVLQLSIGLQF